MWFLFLSAALAVCANGGFMQWGKYVGNSKHGTTYNYDKMGEGLVVNAIYTCVDPNKAINCIKVRYTDGSWSPLVGHNSHYTRYAQTFTIDVGDKAGKGDGGERITEMSLWGNGVGEYLGGIKIRTNRGRLYWPRMKNYRNVREWKSPIGGGIILGIHGKQQWHVRALRFKLLKPVQRMEMTDIKYKSLPTPKLKVLDTVSIPNPTNSDHIVSSNCDIVTADRKDSGGWTATDEHLIGVGVDFSKVPVLGALGIGVNAKYEYTTKKETFQNWESSDTKTKQVCYLVPALTKQKYVTSYYVANGNVDYMAKMKVYTDGGTWSYNMKGRYKFVSTSNIDTHSHQVAKYVNHRWIDCSVSSCAPHAGRGIYALDLQRPMKGAELNGIAIKENMHFEMDVQIKSFSSGWASIFHCGTTNKQRLPGIWIRDANRGFNVRFSDNNEWSRGVVTKDHLVKKRWYHLEVDITKTEFRVTVDYAVRYHADKSPHNTYYNNNMVCYLGDPWFDAADVTVKNLQYFPLNEPGINGYAAAVGAVNLDGIDVDFLEPISSPLVEWYHVHYYALIVALLAMAAILCGVIMCVSAKQKREMKYAAVSGHFATDTESECDVEVIPIKN